jgi:hypothetical protein
MPCHSYRQETIHVTFYTKTYYLLSAFFIFQSRILVKSKNINILSFRATKTNPQGAVDEFKT